MTSINVLQKVRRSLAAAQVDLLILRIMHLPTHIQLMIYIIAIIRLLLIIKGDVHLDFGIKDMPSPPSRPCSLYGRIIQCRSDANAALTTRYGPDWMTPRRWTSHNKRLADARDEIEHETCTKARQEMRDGPCKIQSDLMVGTTGCNGSDAEELGIHNNFNSSTSNIWTKGPFSP